MCFVLYFRIKFFEKNVPSFFSMTIDIDNNFSKLLFVIITKLCVPKNLISFSIYQQKKFPPKKIHKKLIFSYVFFDICVWYYHPFIYLIVQTTQTTNTYVDVFWWKKWFSIKIFTWCSVIFTYAAMCGKENQNMLKNIILCCWFYMLFCACSLLDHGFSYVLCYLWLFRSDLMILLTFFS